MIAHPRMRLPQFPVSADLPGIPPAQPGTRILAEDPATRKARKTFRQLPSTQPETWALRVSAFPLARRGNPGASRGNGPARGGPKDKEVIIMGNRAVITTPERKVGLYVHWNGGRDTIEPLLRYCELKGYRDPAKDEYGWARMCQVLGNFFGGTNCVGIGPYTTDERMDPGDNGIYVIEGWKIVERVGLYDGFVEQQEYDFDQMLRDFDSSMPAGDRLGEFLDSVEVPVGELQVGDEVYMFSHYDDWKAYPVVGFGQPESNRISVWVKADDGRTEVTYPDLPYVAWMDHDGDFSWNSNNYVHGPLARIKPRK